MKKSVLVYGLGRSGKSSIKLLKKDYNVFIYDEDETLKLNLAKEFNVKFIDNFLDTKFLKKLNFVVISPAISIFSENFQILKQLNLTIISELQLGYDYGVKPVVSVTGSNGKTTTVKLIEYIGNYNYKNYEAVGNIGIPLTEKVEENNKNYIAEVSSFQLANITNYKSYISCFLNINENHIDWHRTYSNYIESKKNLIKNIDRNDCVIINLDDEILNNWIPDCKLYYFSMKQKCYGAYCKNGKIYLNIDRKKYICKVKNLKLKGNHNVQNVLCAIICSTLLKVNKKAIVKAIKNFSPLEHRIEFVEKFKNITFINDSKSTSPNACLTAIKSIKNKIVLLIGGKDKSLSYKNLFLNLPKNVEYIIFYGENSKKLVNEFLENNVYSIRFMQQNTLKDAFNFAMTLKIEEFTLLFSPATSSFDEFDNYEERGDFFKKLVRNFINEKK